MNWHWISQEILNAYGDGWLTFVSPCVIPLLVGYLAILTGTRFEDFSGIQGRRSGRAWGLIHLAAFVIGFAVMFLLLALPASEWGLLAWTRQTIIRQLGAVGAILLGLYLARVFPGRLFRLGNTGFASPEAGLAGYFLVGIGLAAAWSPCRLTNMSTIVIYAASEGHLAPGLGLMAAYMFGLLAPLFFGGLVLNFVIKPLRSFRIMRIGVGRGAGLVLVVFGFFLFFNILDRLNLDAAGQLFLSVRNIFP